MKPALSRLQRLYQDTDQLSLYAPGNFLVKVNFITQYSTAKLAISHFGSRQLCQRECLEVMDVTTRQTQPLPSESLTVSGLLPLSPILDKVVWYW